MSEITTAEELDALPVESVVRSHDGYVFEKFGEEPDWNGNPMEPAWHEPNSFDRWDPETMFESFDGPFAVLYCPDRPALSDDDLRAEAARRGMTVVDAERWAQVSANDGGPATGLHSVPESEGSRSLRSGIEALADEWEAVEDQVLVRRAATIRLRALLPADEGSDK